MRMLLTLAKRFSAGGFRGLHRFCRWLRQLAERGGDMGAASSDDAVKIMTIHKSKGLEFPVVFVCDTSRRFNDADLKHINYFFFDTTADFQQRFDELFAIIRTDYAHKEQHTTLELRALEWNRRGRDASFLLIENELLDAQAWLERSAGKEPAPTDLHRAYIDASEKRTRQLRSIRRASVIGSLVAVVAIVAAVGAAVVFTAVSAGITVGTAVGGSVGAEVAVDSAVAGGATVSVVAVGSAMAVASSAGVAIGATVGSMVAVGSGVAVGVSVGATAAGAVSAAGSAGAGV